MVVHHTNNSNEQGTDDKYDATIQNDNAVELSEEKQDDAHNNIVAEDIFQKTKTN